MASLTETEWPSIPDFYAHKDIFVTGATGLMGKCLVEKLLRSVPDLGRVIILMREKKGKTIEERTRDLLSCAVSLWAQIELRGEKISWSDYCVCIHRAWLVGCILYGRGRGRKIAVDNALGRCY